MKLTQKGQIVVKTIKTRMDNLIAEGGTWNYALDAARSGNGHHPGCLSDLTIDHPITDGDWENLVRQGYAEK